MAIDATQFIEALDAIEAAKGISRETTIAALKEAMTRGFRKQLGGDDADVRVNIDPEKGILEMFHVLNIVEEVEDDFLQISKEDAKKEAKAGNGEIRENEFFIPASIEDLRKATAMSIKSILKQKFAEAEKDILLEAFKDKINTMITGKVEKCDEKGASVNIGRTSVFLPKNQMIGDERFAPGDQIRLFVSKVDNSAKGAQILVSRSNEGFLRCLFAEEIREIYDGTIVIKNISREAGERSKVAVYSENPDVDPAGACIGPNGARIQKIVAQLGSGNNKEKIDIIGWSSNIGLFIMESLKPARVCGVVVNEEERKAVAVVKDDSYSLAIGRRGVNARLAVKLTNFNIDIKTETDAVNEGLTYQTFEELQAQEIESRAKALAEAKLAQLQLNLKENKSTDVLPGLPEGYVAPLERKYEEEENTEVKEALEMEDDSTEEVVETKEEVKEVVRPVEKVEELKEVKTTTTLSDLERSLENSGNKTKKFSGKKFNKNKNDDKNEEEEKKVATPASDPSTYMSIYSEEELREIEEEENKSDDSYDSEDEDIDYDEYDEYYDDDNK